MALAQSLASRVLSRVPLPQVHNLVLDMTSRLQHPGAWTASCTGLVVGFRASFYGQSSVLGE
jgi:hypothetical protein